MKQHLIFLDCHKPSQNIFVLTHKPIVTLTQYMREANLNIRIQISMSNYTNKPTCERIKNKITYT